MTSTPWIMIPARGGSRGVPRKNVRLLAGMPLISHVLRTVVAAVPPDHVIVITDDDEIDAIGRTEGVRIVRESTTTGLATLDEVALKVAMELEELGATGRDIFLTVQPTCPFLKAERIQEAVEAFAAGAGSVITVVDDRHLGWRLDGTGKPVPDYKARVNRQQLEPHYRESGAIIGCRLGDLLRCRTRIVDPVRLIEVGTDEALDIDTFADWAVAEYYASRRQIVIRADAGPLLGMGHAYRAVAIAQELARHSVTIATDSAQPLGPILFSRYPFGYTEVDGNEGFVELVRRSRPDLVILDQLDTTADYVNAIKACAGRVVTFEDLGDGASVADLVVSDLYPNLNVPVERQLTGIANAILAPEFETVAHKPSIRAEVERVLVLFGGTDPSRLTEKALEALAASGFQGSVTVVLGPGAGRTLALESFGLRGEILSDVRYMPGVMAGADLAISSAGRTVTELVSLGVPVLCLCQNEKELTHTHASARFGVINLGLGPLVDRDTLAAHIRHLLRSEELRRTLHVRALHETADRSNAAIIRRIMHLIGCY